jgi:putative RNA 2'-phosphotransferase
MPWKELYWALQEDESLRFVRESHIRELNFLGIDLPFHLDDKLLHLDHNAEIPEYPVAEPPEKLYYACRRKQFPVLSRSGLTAPANRSFLPLAVDEGLALTLGRRRDPDPLMIEVEAGKAAEDGVLFREAGPHLYLVESMPPQYLILPTLREEEIGRFEAKKKEEKSAKKTPPPPTPGSFLMDLDHLQEPQPGKRERRRAEKEKKKEKDKRKSQKGPDWKRSARKERRKRDL